MATLKLYPYNLHWKCITKLIIMSMLFYSCEKVEKYEKLSDLQRRNLEGNVCLIIEQKYEINKGEELPISESIIKFNRNGNISSLTEGNEETTFAYNEDGNIIVEKHTKNVLFMGEALEWKPVSDYKKYHYNKTAFPSKIDEYTLNENNLNATTIIERDEYSYKTKEIRIEFKYNDSNHKSYTDTIITLYRSNKKNNYSEVKKLAGKRELLTTYKYDENGLLIYKHEKDLHIFQDSTAIYSLANSQTPQSYEHHKYDENVVYTYERDNRGNTVHLQVCDSTQNKQFDFYSKYTYDNQGNWIKYEYYDNLHELISYITRRIEYYPKAETGEIDYSWENEKSPLEKENSEEKVRKQKEEQYLNDDFILAQFNMKMKEYPSYRVIGNPKITYRQGCTYNINFNATHYYIGGFSEKENITVQIILDLNTDTFSFYPIKGVLN